MLLGSDAAVQSRETPLAFSTGPLAEISISDVGSSEGDGVPTAAAADASSSTVPNIVDSNHVNTSDVPLSTGANMAQDSGPTSKTTGPTFASTNINIISPDSRFSKSVSSNVNALESFPLQVIFVTIMCTTVLYISIENYEIISSRKKLLVLRFECSQLLESRVHHLSS